MHMPRARVPVLALALVCLTSSPDAWAQTCPGPQPEVEPNDTMAQATPLTPPNPAFFFDVFLPAPGFTPPGDVDFFSVPLQADTRLWLLVDTGTLDGGTSRDSVLQVLRPDGTLLEEDDDDGTGMSPFPFAVNTTESSTVAGLRVPATGTYFLRVTARSSEVTVARKSRTMATRPARASSTSS